MLFSFILLHLLHLVQPVCHIILHLNTSVPYIRDQILSEKSSNLPPLLKDSCVFYLVSLSLPVLTFQPQLCSPGVLSFLFPSLCSVQSGFFLSPDNLPKPCLKHRQTQTSYLPSPLIRCHERGPGRCFSPLVNTTPRHSCCNLTRGWI